MKDNKYFPHDADAAEDAKCVCLINKMGYEGYGRYWKIIETLRSCDEYKLNTHGYIFDAMAYKLKMKNVEELKEFIEYLESIDLLQQDSDKIFSAALTKRMITFDTLRINRSAAGKIGANARWGNVKVENKDEAIKGILDLWNTLSIQKSKYKKVDNFKNGLLETFRRRLDDSTFSKNISMAILWLSDNDYPLELSLEDLVTSENKFNSLLEMMR